MSITLPVFPASSPEGLQVETGFSTRTGPRERNEDYVGAVLAPPHEQEAFGAVAAIADGVGGGQGSRFAAELAVRGFMEGYFGAVPTLGVKRIAARSVNAMNSWLHALSLTDPALAGMATTLTLLIFRGRTAHIVHVGDSRAYRRRNDQLALLTQDHVLNAFESRHVLTRSLGGRAQCSIDYSEEALQAGDRFLLCTDGVHGALNDRALADHLRSDAQPGEIARSLTLAALAAGSRDNATALVVDVVSVPKARLADVESAIAALPITPPPKVGDVVDGLRMDRLVVEGIYTCVFKATDLARDTPVFVKFPRDQVVGDGAMRQAFVRENWIASLIRSPYVGVGLERERSRLYSAMTWYDGETLESRLERGPKIGAPAGLDIAAQLIKGVAALHRAGVIHRDIKPDNIILVAEGGVRLIDLGVARAPRLDEFPEALAPGTPNYMAPELYAGGLGDERSDIFALGVTVFRVFTGGFPYAETDVSARPSFRPGASLSKLRPDLPYWIGPMLARACAFHPRDRHEDAIELLFDLERGRMSANAIKPPRAPLYDRDPVLVWKLVSAALALALAATLLIHRSPMESTGGPAQTPPTQARH